MIAARTIAGEAMAGDSRLERQRAAIELRLQRAEQAIARRKLALAEAELAQKGSSGPAGGFRFLLTPTGVVLIAPRSA